MSSYRVSPKSPPPTVIYVIVTRDSQTRDSETRESETQDSETRDSETRDRELKK